MIKKLVSIGVITYNSEDTIIETLDSIKNLKYKEFAYYRQEREGTITNFIEIKNIKSLLCIIKNGVKRRK